MIKVQNCRAQMLLWMNEQLPVETVVLLHIWTQQQPDINPVLPELL